VTSTSHRLLVLWIARLMSRDGLRVTCFDGPADQGGIFNELPAPFAARGQKPDVWAIDVSGGLAAAGEAKTSQDIGNVHTIAQFQAFARIPGANGQGYCPLYIAVPRSGVIQLDRVLSLAGLAGSKNIRRLHVPDVLLDANAYHS